MLDCCLQVEMLYQRYFLRMNQSNMTHLLGLLLALCTVLGLLQLASDRDVAIGLAVACCVAVYAGLIAVLSRPALNELYLLGVSYVVVGSFLALEITLGIYTQPPTGMGAAMFFIYLTYSLLPIRLQEAVGAGLMQSAAQLVCVLALHHQVWTQVIY